MNEGPNAFLFMRVGNHAGETFDEILERKQRELERAGMIFWGYGGTTLHPVRHVQPFVKLWAGNGGRVEILLQPIVSRADPDVLPANEYSVDGIEWKPLPDGVSVTGSRYAVVLDEIKPGQLDLDLSRFEVGIGPSRGRNAADYVRNRVDKGCLVATEGAWGEVADPKVGVKVQYRAQLQDPYAVMLRNTER